MDHEIERQPQPVGIPVADGVRAGTLAESALDVVVGELPDDEAVEVWTLNDDADGLVPE